MANDHPTHTLHPTPGAVPSLLTRKEGYLLTLSWTSLFCSHVPAPAIMYINYPSCKLSFTTVTHAAATSTLNKPVITLKYQFLDAEPQHVMTTYIFTIIAPVGIKIKLYCLYTIWTIFLVPSLCSHLGNPIRLFISCQILKSWTPSSTEDESKYMVFTWVLDPVPPWWLDVSLIMLNLVNCYLRLDP